VALFVFQLCINSSEAFVPSSFITKSYLPFATSKCSKRYTLHSAEDQNLDAAVEDTEDESFESFMEDNTGIERNELKKELLKLSASYDRGYGATSTSRDAANDIIDRLKILNPTQNASQGIDGDDTDENTPLKGIWQMIWTTAADVLILNASPFSTVGAIYQVITDPPIITNVIDLIPRSQALLPINVAPSLLRLEVTTRAKSRSDPNRIGLIFEKVQAQPMQILGFDNLDFLPPLKFNLPTLSNIPEIVQSTLNIDMNSDTAPGFFDVLYLDDELLIIRQNDPGGIFVLVKSDSFDP